jgi:hypothetical protein
MIIGFFIVGISALLVRVAIEAQSDAAPLRTVFEMPIVYRGNVLALSTAAGLETGRMGPSRMEPVLRPWAA